MNHGTSTMNPAADPITLEVVRNKLDGIANEMQSTLVRSSFSPIVKEGLDASASLFTLEGETLAQATAIPIHLATLIPVVRTVIGKFPVETMREGDVYIMNDPYHGGTHLPDIALVMPIFSRGRPIAFSAAMTSSLLRVDQSTHPGRQSAAVEALAPSAGSMMMRPPCAKTFTRSPTAIRASSRTESSNSTACPSPHF